MTTASRYGGQFRMDEGAPIVAVTEAIAELEGTEPTDLPPLYESIDPEALYGLCRSLETGQVSFTYHGYRITVRDTLEFTVEPA